MPSVDYDTFAVTIRRLLHILIEQRGDIEVLTRTLAATAPLSLSTYEEVRQQVAKEIAPALKSVDETPSDKIEEFLRNFQGTVQ